MSGESTLAAPVAEVRGTVPEILHGPIHPSPDVRWCDVGGHRLSSPAWWWVVKAKDRGWWGDLGSACAEHSGQMVPARRSRAPRDGYAQAIEALREAS